MQIWTAYGNRLASITKHFYIAVRPETTRDDVYDALHVPKAGFPTRSKGRPERDVLLCVQLAVWHDRLGGTNQEIASHQGWQLNQRPGAKARSVRVREHY